MKLISVIIPAYNAEKTIERTVRSVMASTLPVDVYVVNDGSTDSTKEILDSLAGEFDNMVVIHQANCGAYQARLNALKRVTTKYFGFVDADDTIKPDIYEKMVNFAEIEKLDVVQCGYMIGDIIGHIDYVKNNGFSLLTGEALDKFKFGYLINTQASCFIWDKIYRNQYDFGAFDLTDNVTNFDDMIFNLQFFLIVQRMGLVDEALYHYGMTEGSAVHSFSEAKVKDFEEAKRIREKYLPKYGVAVDCAANRKWVRLNRMNCIKATIKASNLEFSEKLRLVWKLIGVKI